MTGRKKSGQKINIRVVSTAGFCFGVRRAYEKALATVNENPERRIATIGPLIHNPQVVAQLEKEGVQVINDIHELQTGILIVRSHGLPPDIIRTAQQKGIDIVDATCPYVKKLQKDAVRLRSEGYFVILVGDKDHPEIRAVQGALKNGYIVVKDLSELKKVDLPDKIAFLAQTTQNHSSFQKVVVYGLRKGKEVKVFNTICDSTHTRQKMTQKLASEVDLMFIVGGRNSANTNRLYDISRQYQTRTYLVEVADEIESCYFDSEIRKVGISAGASTPGWIIDQVVAKIRELTED